MRSTRFTFLAAGLACVLTAAAAAAQTPPAATPAVRDGLHDFDWMVGNWKAHLKRLENPLTGSTKWVEFDGTQRTWLAWGGRSAMDEFTVKNAADQITIDALTVRLYDKAHDQWSIYWANARNGSFSMPATVGRWTNGRGEFYDHGGIRRPLDPGPLRLDRRDPGLGALRAVVLGRRRQDLGSQLDLGHHADHGRRLAVAGGVVARAAEAQSLSGTTWTAAPRPPRGTGSASSP